MPKSRGRGTRGHRPAQEEIEAAEGLGANSDSDDSDSDEELKERKKASATEGLIETANPNDRKFKSAIKLSELGDAPSDELAGRLKREIDEQAEREREAQATAKGTNEEGAANLARLEETRRRRAEAAAKREEEAAAAEAARRGGAPEPELDQSVEVSDASEKKKKKKSKKGSKADRPKVPVPPPKEMKAALIRLQGIAASDFLSRHSLKKASGNKLAKMKRAEFEKIMADFQETAAVSELEEFLDE